ncbi:signal peptidase I [Actinoplanes sp. NPDC049599]|uniref:signal peptidase I n=1 Tax=Actinoplanes sp. NPDC049599 TaxID=3363903 RepID=UPI0037AB33E5
MSRSGRRSSSGGARLHGILFSTVLLIAVAFVAGSAALTALGVKVMPVLSGSMSPTIATNALVVATPVAAHDVRVGDVMVFNPPTVTGSVMVMHRVVELRTVDGTRTMITRGDANPGPDPWAIDLNRSALYRVTYAIPYAGRAYRALHATATDPHSSLLWAGIAAGFLAFGVSLRLRRRNRPGDTWCADHGSGHRTKPDPVGEHHLQSVSLELRHRLTSILGYSEVLTEHNDHRSVADLRMATTVHDHAQRLSEVLDELTALAEESTPPTRELAEAH